MGRKTSRSGRSNDLSGIHVMWGFPDFSGCISDCTTLEPHAVDGGDNLMFTLSPGTVLTVSSSRRREIQSSPFGASRATPLSAVLDIPPLYLVSSLCILQTKIIDDKLHFQIP
jgi:hypothetical protein